MFEGPLLQIAAAFPKIAFRLQVFAKKMLHVIDISSSQIHDMESTMFPKSQNNIQSFRISLA